MLSGKNSSKKISDSSLLLRTLFIAPFRAHLRLEDYRRSIVITSFFLITLVAIILEQIVGGNTPFIAVVFLIIGYFFSRTRWYKWATFLLLLTLSFPTYQVAFSLPEPNANNILTPFAWLALPIILASLIYSIRTNIILNFINIVAIGALPFLRDEITFLTISGILGFCTTIAFIVIIVMNQRNQIEFDHQSEMKAVQNKLEIEIKQHMEAIVERDRLISELEQFAFTASHDLKNPLTTIGVYLGVLERDIVAGKLEKTKDDIFRIGNATKKMQVLLDELQGFSRVGHSTIKVEETSLDEIIREAMLNVEGKIKKSGVNTIVNGNMPTVIGNRSQLIIVFQNLIDNSIKYMGNQPEPRIQIGMKEKNGENVFFVSDNGIGIEERYFDKIFDIFEKLDPESSGTGIGLSLAKRIVESHNGKIWVESKPKKGSTFCFTLGKNPK